MSEPSLDFPPVYRHMLAGGPDRLRITLSGAAFVLLTGLVVLGLAAVADLARVGHVRWLGGVGRVAASIPVAVLTAALAARWLGQALGVLAGVLFLGSFGVLAGRIDAWPAMAACLAMGALGITCVPGRRDVWSGRGAAVVFHLALGATLLTLGPPGGIAILLSGLLYVVLSHDQPTLRALVGPKSLSGLTGLTGLWWMAASAGLPWVAPVETADLAGRVGFQLATIHSLSLDVLVATLPWTPLAIGAIVLGCRVGHYATPFWQFIAAWTLGPLLAAVIGLLEPSMAAAMVCPPLAILSASGAAGVWPVMRKLFRRLAK